MSSLNSYQFYFKSTSLAQEIRSPFYLRLHNTMVTIINNGLLVRLAGAVAKCFIKCTRYQYLKVSGSI